MSVEAYYSYRRLVYEHDPILGYRFIPNLYARINRPKNTFVIQTNDQGFRDNTSFDDASNRGATILALGDSYLAGDGISNSERFMNILSERLDVNVLNMGLPGSGNDQQLLIQERVAADWNHDILMVVPFVHNLKRNLTSRMYILDWISRRRIDIRKPYFKLVDGVGLQLCNTPVPLAADFFSKNQNGENVGHSIRKMVRTKLPPLHKVLRLQRSLYHSLVYRTNVAKADVDYADNNSYGWRLTRAIFERMIENAGSRPVVIIPMPLYQHIRFGAHPHYLDRFRELIRPNVHVVDVLGPLRALSFKERKELFIPDGHFSAKANQHIASLCLPLFRKLTRGRGNRAAEKAPRSKTAQKKPKYILGVSCFYHDSAAAVLRDGRIIAAAQEERFTRVKHDKSFPSNAINYCLEEARIDGQELDAVVHYDSEYLTLERMIASQLYVGNANKSQLEKTLPNWVAAKFNIWSHIRQAINYSGPLYRALHHRSHAASAFYPSPFDEAAIVTIDGVGEWSTTTLGLGEGNQIRILEEHRFPHSLGLLYSAFTSFCGFKVNSGEYKLMGLAPYGKPRYRDTIRQNLVEVKEDGSFKLNLRYFSFLEGKRMTNGHFEGLFGGSPRRGDSPITERECDLASSIQSVINEVVLRIIKHAHEASNKDNLVLAGGVALNCVANGKILEQGPFKKLWIQPAAGDAGGALGAALDLWYGTWENPRTVGATDQHDSCFGPSFSDREIKSFLDFHHYAYHKLTKQNRADVISKSLLQGKVVSHFSSRMEYGPRALGSRSILADPRNTDMQKTLNMKVKYRESFRPFAPAVLEERIGDYFTLDAPSPYMLFVAPVKDRIAMDVSDEQNGEILARLNQKRSSIPAVTHVDYSARIQSVSRNRYPELCDILESFHEKTGCGVLVNTSFNVRGEPIVCTPEDAYKCFMRTEIDVLIMNDFLLKKDEQPIWQEDQHWSSIYELD